MSSSTTKRRAGIFGDLMHMDVSELTCIVQFIVGSVCKQFTVLIVLTCFQHLNSMQFDSSLSSLILIEGFYETGTVSFALISKKP